MSREPVALLFMPPWEPIRLRRYRSVVIGRSPSCDLPVPSPHVSRRQAWVRNDNGRFLVADLGSTNGTFVNGELVVGERELRAGDRIGVGDHVITFCLMQPGRDGEIDADPGETLAGGTPVLGGPDALQGDLTQIPMFALLQMLEVGQKSGALELRGPHGRSRLWLTLGRPSHAEHVDLRGFKAAVAISHLSAGRFTFEPGVEAPETTIRCSIPELLLETSRQFDEARR